MGQRTADVQRAYVDALRAGDRRRAFGVVSDARADGLDVQGLYMDVLQPAMREIGRLWQQNEMTVAQEHLATAITQMVMARAYDEIAAAAPVSAHSAIAACAAAERHELGLRMICDLLERAGWDATYLGAAVPTDSLVRLTSERRPDALVLSASIAPHLPELQRTIAAVRDAMGGAAPYIIVGGRPFLDDEGLAAQLGADGTARDAAAVVRCLTKRFP